MDQLPQLQWKANESLAERFHPGRVGQYDNVLVLLIRWQECDLVGLVDEEELLAQIFTNNFHYQVERFQIPMDHGELALTTHLYQFMLNLRAQPNSLGIIHYGGHGDDDIDPILGHSNARGVWASHYQGGSTLCWSDIQPQLAKADTDILLLLDCCYAAQAARGSGDLIIPSNVEILAACAKGRQTPGPMTPQSFTLALIRELEEGLARIHTNGPITVQEIHQRLTSRKAGLKETPVYFPMKKGTVRLDSLSSQDPIKFDQTPPEFPSITLKMMLRKSISDGLVDDIVLWLKQNAPPGIAQVKITELADRAMEFQEFISEDCEQQNSASLIQMDKLTSSSQNQIKNAWSEFAARLVGSLRHIVGGEAESMKNPDMDLFLRDFEANTSSLQRVVECEVLNTPELHEIGDIEQVIQQPRSQILGLVESFRVRLLSILPDTDMPSPTFFNWKVDMPGYQVHSVPKAPDSLSVETHPQWSSRVLVEWKTTLDPASRELDVKRLRRLVAALGAATTDHFRTPRCLGYILPSQVTDSRYGIVFEAPQGREPVTLYTLLHEQQTQSGRKIVIPTLNERFRIAFEIGQALMRWHAARWVHQGLASFHVVFFKGPNGSIDYGQPYLVGFDNSRENFASSAARRRDQPQAEAIRDIYRHPDRQGSAPIISHQKQHDLYALGLILIEIGRWMPLETMFRNIIAKPGGTAAVHGAALKMTERVLAHNMGTSYRDATLLSLMGDLPTQGGEYLQSKFAANVELQIIQNLEEGLKIGT
ncbi:hypothetical protein HJFPF1_11089 [Paramyrothecium foliicola]|nr:hypothetical protein HJFPF1_11089 [Paramyrothecium foliicola]